MPGFIKIQGARLHNLKNIDLQIPWEKLVVITGPSGSGKSTLAFDTLYAEGQRRFVESLSAYARQFLEKMPKPEVDSITGIHPAIAIQQKAPSGNPRSTVGTVTEIYDYLRLLFSRIGDIHCPNCGTKINKDQPQDVLNFINELPMEEKFYIAYAFHIESVIIPGQVREAILSRGFLRVWQGGSIVNLQTSAIDPKNTELFVIADRYIKTDPMDRNRLIDAIETAFFEGEGRLVLIRENGEMQNFDQNFVCSNCRTKLIEPQPRLFSFNNPFGACPGCQGFGDMTDLDLNKIIPDPGKSLNEGAIVPWNSRSHRTIRAKLAAVAPKYGISLDQPYHTLSENQQNLLIEGSKDFIGIRGFFKRLERKKYKVHVRVFISRFRSYFTCTLCHGKRLRPEALAITIAQKDISELVKLTIGDLHTFFSELKISEHHRTIARQILSEIHNRLSYLKDVGLDYLHLNRRANTLSGGEFQRINLATALGTGLTGTLYILDEPTIGLHPRDTMRLITILKSLRDLGNTTIVVEHERAVIENADYIIDLGPAAGEAGGRVMYQGDFQKFLNFRDSLTAQYYLGEKTLSIKKSHRKGNGFSLTILGAAEHNLKNIDVRIPLGKLVAVTGVSGSGKSTLIHDVLYQGYLANRGENRSRPGRFSEIRGQKHIYRMEMIDQSPIGRTPRSNPITYIKGFDEIRKLFSSLSRSKARGLTPGHFSFNVKGGRCDNCEGDGHLKIDMQFLADVYITCDVCNGKRYKKEILDITYRDKNIHNILTMTVDESLHFFIDFPSITRRIQVLQDVGLGYLRLGQSATTLSGGEAQRVKLAAHLSKKSHKDILFLFDEPTTGLHFDDINKLMQAFDMLLEKNASILVIEHNLDVIANADWIIDLGPEGGVGGGAIVAEGTPEEITRVKKSYTGQFLKQRGDISKSIA